ncbi:MAG: hypothetical protein AAF391_12805 [Bacteroidota bacterium]
MKTSSIFFLILIFTCFNSYGQISATWEDLVNVTVSNDRLTKTGGASSWGDGGAASIEFLDSGEDGWVQTTAIETNKARMIGLSETNTNASHSTINYAVYLRHTATLQVYENGVFKYSGPSYSAGDVVRVDRTAGVITYRKNGAVFYTSTVSSSTSLLVDVAIHHINSTLDAIQLSSGFGNTSGQSTSTVWSSTTGGDIFYNQGKVGIGTTSPSKLLDVNGDARIGSLSARRYLKISSSQWPEVRFETPNSNEQIRLGVAHANNSNYGVSEGDFYVYSATVDKMGLIVQRDSDVLLNAKYGNVGIGTTNPSEKLHVNGNIVLGFEPSPRFDRSISAYVVESTHFYGHTSNGPIIIGESGNSVSLRGKLNIGSTSVPSGYKLAVDGKIITEEVNVQVSSLWPDYVFNPEYDLKSLEEIEQFIQSNNHLPEIPSAQEIEANGMELGEMNRLLLQKIEELTLHLIEVNKENTNLHQQLTVSSHSQEEKMETLAEQLTKQQKMIEALQKEIKRINQN